MATKIYIKMCEKADEIQELWIPGLGDICINKIDGKEVMVVASRGKIADKEYKFVYLGIGSKEQRDYWHKKDKLVLLPTQGQLQESVVNPILNIAEFSKWALKAIEGAEYYMQFGSWRELWLAFAMEEKYHKIWAGNDWRIKEDKNG